MTTKNRVLLIAYFSFIVIGMTGGLLNIAWTYMQDTFNVSLDSLGVILTVATGGILIAAFSNGRIIGQYGIGTVLLGGAILAGIGFGGYIIAPLWVILLILTFIGSLGKGTIDAGMNNFVSANFGTREMNWLHACWGIGLTMAPSIVTFTVLNLELSWQWSYLAAFALIVSLIIAFLLTFKHWHIGEEKTKVAHQPQLEKRSVGFRETLQSSTVRLSVLLFFVYGGVEIGTGQLANTLFVESRGIDQEISSAWVTFYWLSFTIGRLLGGFLANKLGDLLLMRSSMVLAVGGGILLWLNLGDVTSFLGLAMIGFGLASIFPTLIAQTPARVGVLYAANVIGFQVGFAGFGGAFLPGITGILAENMGLEVISLLIMLNAFSVLFIYEWLLRRESRQAEVT